MEALCIIVNGAQRDNLMQQSCITDGGFYLSICSLCLVSASWSLANSASSSPSPLICS